MMAFALFTCTWPTGIDWLLNTANQRREYLGRIGNERSQFGLGCLEQRPKLFFSIILLFFLIVGVEVSLNRRKTCLGFSVLYMGVGPGLRRQIELLLNQTRYPGGTLPYVELSSAS